MLDIRTAHIKGTLFMDTLQRLREAGLQLVPLEPTAQHDQGYHIWLPADLGRVTITDPSPEAQSASSGTGDTVTCRLYQKHNQWVIERWERIPGPDESDFVCHFPTLEEALTAVHAFYFGAPTTLDGWLIPLHHHPELSPADVRSALDNAVNVSEEAFAALAERRQLRITGNPIFGLDRWSVALQYQFLPVKHENNRYLELQLRRDLQEAYIVHLDGETSE